MRPCLIALCLLGCESKPTAPAARPPSVEPAESPAPARDRQHREFLRGVSLGLFVSDADPVVQRRHYTTFLDEIRALGASDVQFVVRWAQTDVRSHDLAPTPGITVSDDMLLWVLAAAEKRGLRPFVLPIVHLKIRAKGEWRGRLAPTDPDAWWRAYGGFILHYARLSASRAHMLAVGSELVSLERHTARWRALITQVRAAFPGRLTYSANWDHFETIGFWRDLDVVGVTAYQPLARTPNPDAATLDAGWKPFVGRLRSWAARENHRYLFTEVGYPSNPYAAVRPWDYRERGAPDLDLQARCYASLRRVWAPDPRLAGVYLWNWFGKGGVDDRGYTPRGKPAAALIEAWFAAP